ncbi:MAG: serine hydrolase domain-containing protein [Aestuariivirga sp.]
MRPSDLKSFQLLAVSFEIRRLLVALLVLLMAFPTHTANARDDRIQRIETAFNKWITKYSVKDASLAIVIDGVIAGQIGHGGYTTEQAVPVASLSKAITGICIAKLVESGKLRFNQRIGIVIASYFSKNPPKDARAKRITIAQLLTHTSGITHDPTQGGELDQFQPFSNASMERQLQVALTAPLGRTKFAYNNMNYAALGIVIQTVTGEDHDKFCSREVLEPVGVQGAGLNPDWRMMGAFGGWNISAADYAKFLGYFDPSRRLLGVRPANWPKTDLNGASYSLGTLMRRNGSGYNFWHFGSWTRNIPTASFGAYFAMWGGKVGVVANYSPSISEAAELDLDKALYDAAFR